MKIILIIIALLTITFFTFCQEDEEDNPAIQGTQTEQSTITGIVSDPSWGFKFHTPLGWKAQKDASGAILGHDKVAGMILVYPHSAKNLEEMEQQMQEGLQKDGNYLTSSGEIKSSGKNILTGDYEGMYDGEGVKGKGIGTLSPHGGGAYIIAISTPEKFGKEISKAADAIAKSMQYVKPNVSSNLLQTFAGTWTNYTKSTETNFTLLPNGEFYENYEASYSGQDADWGYARQDKNGGRWTVKGNRERGIITLNYNNGNVSEIEYQVHIEKGEAFWNEYLFNGDLYFRQK